MTDAPPNRPAAANLLKALIAMLPNVSARGDLGFREDAREDAVMDAILRVLEAEERTPQPVAIADRVSARYASRVVHNLLIDRFRRERHLPTESLDEVSDRPLDEEHDSRRSATQLRRANALLRELTSEEHKLISAYFTGSDAFHDETRELGISDNTARVRVHRLIKRLRNRAAEQWGTGSPPR